MKTRTTIENIIKTEERRRKAILKLLKHCLKIKIFLVTIIALIIVATIMWFSSASRSAGFISDFIISKIQEEIAPYKIRTSDIKIQLDTDRYDIVAQLENFELNSNKQKKVLALPQVKLKLSAIALLQGKVEIDELILKDATIIAYRQDNGGLSFVFTDTEQKEEKSPNSGNGKDNSAEAIAAKNLLEALKSLRLKNIVMYDAALRLGSGNNKKLINAPHISLMLKLNRRKPEIELNASLMEINRIIERDTKQRNSKTVNVRGKAYIGSDARSVEVDVAIQRFSPEIAETIDWRLSRASNVKMLFDGYVSLRASIDEGIKYIRANMSSNDGGVITSAGFFEADLNINSMNIDIEAINNLSEVTLNNLSLFFPKGSLRLSGNINYLKTGSSDGDNYKQDKQQYSEENKEKYIDIKRNIIAELKAEAKNVDIVDITRYWPVNIATKSRSWVKNNLLSGNVPKAVANIDIRPEYFTGKHVNEKIINASIDVRNGSLSYMKEFPKVRNIDAVVKFTGHSMKIIAHKARTMSGAEIIPSQNMENVVKIEDFFARGSPMEVSLNIKAPASDIAELLSNKRLNDLSEKLNLVADEIRGEASGIMRLRFPVNYKTAKRHYFDYDIAADMSNITQKKLLHKWDIENAAGTIEVMRDSVKTSNKNIVKLDAKGKLQNIESNVSLTYEGDNISHKATYNFKALVPVEQLHRLGIPQIEYIAGGDVHIDAEITDNSDYNITHKSKVKLGLTKTLLKAENIGWVKPVGIPAKSEFTFYEKDGTIYIDNMSLDSNNLAIKGNIVINDESIHAQLDRAKYKGSDISIDYREEKTTGKKNINIAGKILDISQRYDASSDINQRKKTEYLVSTASPFDIFSNMEINIDVEKLVLGDEKQLYGVKGAVNCDINICEKVSITATYGSAEGDKKFTMSIKPIKRKRHLSIKSNDAGETIRIFGISDYVKGGKLSYEGYFKKQNSAEAKTTTAETLYARLIITDFRVVKGPILAELLTMASLTGIFDTLQGKGIAFTKLGANTEFNGDSFKITKGKAYGNALGITVEGTVYPFKNPAEIDIKGILVPAYTANSIIGNIPVLGNILTGGSGSVIAMNYSIKGNNKKPKATVNPLSLLTPGFLRNLFDVFDKK